MGIPASWALGQALWLFANAIYAAQRAQGATGTGRVVAFILGLPLTLVSVVAVTEGSERAYGVDLPTKIRGRGERFDPVHPERSGAESKGPGSTSSP